jgi:molybdate transport system substrate-binding protein
MNKRLIAAFWFVAALAALPIAIPARQASAMDPPIVAAAADLQFALVEVAAAFKAETGKEVQISFGSSGNFFRQIQQGAPFQMYLSADEAFVNELDAARLTVDGPDPGAWRSICPPPTAASGAGIAGATR